MGVRVVARRQFVAGNREAAAEPVAEIEHLAALRAERAPGIGFIEAHRLSALRAGTDAVWACAGAGLVAHRLQHCSWKSISDCDCCARADNSRIAMKRTVKRWRPALIDRKSTRLNSSH